MEEVGNRPTRKLSKTEKRRLRRERRANMPPIVSEPKPDGPRLTKTAKRKLRMKKRRLLQLSESRGYISFRPPQVRRHLDLENDVKFTEADKEYRGESSTLVECKTKLPEAEEEPKPKNMRKTDSIECHSSFKSSHIRWDLEPESKVKSLDVDMGNYSENNPTLEEYNDTLGLLDGKVKQKLKKISNSDSDEGQTTFRPRHIRWDLEPENDLKPPAIDRDVEAKLDGNLTVAEFTDTSPEGKAKPNYMKIRKTVSKSSVNVDDNDTAVLLPSDIDQSATIVSRKSDSNLRNEGNTLKKTDGKTFKKRPSRYVLFVGNLPYTLTKEKIIEHFGKTDYPLKDVRLVMQENDKNLNRGFAYVEFASEDGYLNALKLHHSILDGRRINVEYSTATKGKNAKSKSFIKKKTLKLMALVGKYKKQHS